MLNGRGLRLLGFRALRVFASFGSTQVDEAFVTALHPSGDGRFCVVDLRLQATWALAALGVVVSGWWIVFFCEG